MPTVGAICYAVLRYEAKGEPEKLLGVALDALSLDSENECLVVAADDAALRQTRGFDRDAPPLHDPTRCSRAPRSSAAPCSVVGAPTAPPFEAATTAARGLHEDQGAEKDHYD